MSVLGKFVAFALAWPRLVKRLVALTVDLSCCVITVWLAYFLRLGEFRAFDAGAVTAALLSVVIALPIFIVSGLYRAIFRYAGHSALVAVARAAAIYGLIYAVVITIVGVEGVPRTIGLIQPLLLWLSVSATRSLAGFWLGDKYRFILKKAAKPRVLIYGAGSSGRQLASSLVNSSELQLAGFLDDDSRLHGQLINRQPVFDPAKIQTVIARLKVRTVLLAMPNVDRDRRNAILDLLSSASVLVRTVPSMADLVQGRVDISDLRELDLDDLLARPPVAPDLTLFASGITGKVVAVTGAGGSIGSELCRQIGRLAPAKLLLIDHSEYALYAIHHELNSSFQSPDPCLVPLLASVQDVQRIEQIMAAWKPDTVYHAAAYKHVPLVEHNVADGIKNNVFGTLNTALAATRHGVTNFVLISTDKAVRPTNVMGASKRLAEMLLQALASTKTTTVFTMVRFGNVLGSSGSVVPKFREQIRAGGPVTVTHPDITRYFMTIPEAAQLVIQAGAMGEGGDVFVLDMGQPVKILDLARRMVALSGRTVRENGNPEGDIAIEFIGLRPGEKLYEELLIGEDPEATSHPKIWRARDKCSSWDELTRRLATLQKALDANDAGTIRAVFQEIVIGYHPNAEIVDWYYAEHQRTTYATDFLKA